MNIGYTTVVPYRVRRQIPPTLASTSPDSTTLCAATLGGNYVITLQCLAGTIAYSVCGETPSDSVGNQIVARDSNCLTVNKSDANPDSVCSIVALSTNSAYQVWVMA